MPATSKHLSRPEEFNRLLVEQATVTRSMRYGHVPDDEAKDQAARRATRLIELAELIGYEAEPEAYVNERIAAWLRMNPLVLDQRRVQIVLEKPLVGLDSGVAVVIGDPGDGGYRYQLLADDLRWAGGASGDLQFHVPDSIAEHFRQQGRRALQAELRDLINAERR